MTPEETRDRIVQLANDQIVRLNEQISFSADTRNVWSSRNTVVRLDKGLEAEIEVKVRIRDQEIQASEVDGAS